MSDAYWARPARPSRTGVLVLAGSSGRVDADRADRFAEAGVTALAIRWFGGEGQPDVPREVPLETFVSGLDRLAGECDRLGLLGLSYGAEAALFTAARDARVSAVVALAPTDVVWEGQARTDDDPPVSKWTWRGEGLPFVPLDRGWVPASSPPAFRPLYERSRAIAGAEVVAAAAIRAERI